MERRDFFKGAAGIALAFGAMEAVAQDGGVGPETVYELRIYHLNEGKLPLILNRFRTKETAIFARLGMHGVGYWTPTDEPLAGRTLVYMLRHKSREAATESWKRFSVDSEWVAVKAESEKDGVLVKQVESVYLDPTDYSPIK